MYAFFIHLSHGPKRIEHISSQDYQWTCCRWQRYTLLSGEEQATRYRFR